MRNKNQNPITMRNIIMTIISVLNGSAFASTDKADARYSFVRSQHYTNNMWRFRRPGRF